jgi:hypothetical protein
MKKISMILMAFALAMTMSQCKKNEGQPTSNDEVVTITLDVTQNNGSRVVVNPLTGTVDFETGDKIYVGSGGKYVGFLTHNGTNFVGNITNPTENQPLQFYFLGNVTPTETLAAGATEVCSVIIRDQTEHLPVISCAASYENYVSGVTAYSAHLLNKCALVKFNVTTPSNSPICITGMHNKVTVDFTQNTVTPSMDGEGVIMLPAGSGENVEKWVILLPQDAVDEGIDGSAYSEDGTYFGMRPAIPTIIDNGYLPHGISAEINNTVASDIQIGAINGLFTINANGDQVYFSKGNLQYIGSASIPYWKFADNQWDCLGSTTGQNSESQNVDRDLFGWGTSGYIHEHCAFCYQPWSTSTNVGDYWPSQIVTGYNYFMSGQGDWGYNAIYNGGNTENNGWRTPTKDEWEYLLTTYAKAEVNGINGLILLPNNWDPSIYTLDESNNLLSDFNSNIISASEWITILEANGAVFLPAAGQRVGNTVSNVGYDCNYWSSLFRNPYGDTGPVRLKISNEFIDTRIMYASEGYSVRLVKDYNP